MKIRLRGQSIRFRLGRSEVARLAGGQAVQEATLLAPGRSLICTMQAGGAAATLTFDDARIAVTVPASRLNAWANGDAVGIDETLAVGSGVSLRLLIEKDFVCIDAAATDGGGESQADAFPNPAAVCTPAADDVR